MTVFLAGFRESLPPRVRDRLRKAADRLLPYRKRLWELDSQYRALQTANVEAEQRLMRFDEQNCALQAANSEAEQQLMRLDEQNRALEAANAEQEQRLMRFDEQNRALRAANAEQEQGLTRLDEQNRALHAANAEQEQGLTRLDEQNRELQVANLANAQHIAQLGQQNQELAAIRLAHQDRLAHLEAHIAALTTAAVERENKLGEKAELDYQLLMIHQQLLAEFADAEPRFREIYERCKPFTMTSIERLYSLYKSVEYVAAAEIPGDLVECGVWRGGSCMLMAAALLSLGKPDRRILMFDTFEGHPPPDPERDIDLWGNRAREEWRSQTHDGAVKGWGRAPLEEVISNLHSTGYPGALFRCVKGMVEDTAPHNVPQQLALLRLDTDWYASTRAALLHFYPRLVSGGVLILDDYGHYRGQRQAVDEYFSATGEPLLFHRIDYSCRIAVKR